MMVVVRARDTLGTRRQIADDRHGHGQHTGSTQLSTTNCRIPRWLEAVSAAQEVEECAPKKIFRVYDDLLLLGFSDAYARPDWMTLTTIRLFCDQKYQPTADYAKRGRFDLKLVGYKLELGDIVKASTIVRKCEEGRAPAHVSTGFG